MPSAFLGRLPQPVLDRDTDKTGASGTLHTPSPPSPLAPVGVYHANSALRNFWNFLNFWAMFQHLAASFRTSEASNMPLFSFHEGCRPRPNPSLAVRDWPSASAEVLGGSLFFFLSPLLSSWKTTTAVTIGGYILLKRLSLLGGGLMRPHRPVLPWPPERHRRARVDIHLRRILARRLSYVAASDSAPRTRAQVKAGDRRRRSASCYA